MSLGDDYDDDVDDVNCAMVRAAADTLFRRMKRIMIHNSEQPNLYTEIVSESEITLE